MYIKGIYIYIYLYHVDVNKGYRIKIRKGKNAHMLIQHERDEQCTRPLIFYVINMFESLRVFQNINM